VPIRSSQSWPRLGPGTGRRSRPAVHCVEGIGGADITRMAPPNMYQCSSSQARKSSQRIADHRIPARTRQAPSTRRFSVRDYLVEQAIPALSASRRKHGVHSVRRRSRASNREDICRRRRNCGAMTRSMDALATIVPKNLRFASWQAVGPAIVADREGIKQPQLQRGGAGVNRTNQELARAGGRPPGPDKSRR